MSFRVGGDVINVPNTVIGRGYDSVNAEEKAPVLEDAPLVTPGDPNGQNTYFECDEIRDYESLVDILGIDANASFGFGLYSVSGSVDYFKSRAFNSYDEYIYVQVIVENPIEKLKSIKLNRAALEYAKRGPAAFYENCGDRCVIGRQTGGRYLAIAKIACRSQEEKEAVRSELSASGIFGGGEAKFSSGIQRITSKYSLSLRVIREGTSKELPDVSTLLGEVRRFPTEVKVGSAAATYLLFTTRYNNVENLPANLQNQQRTENRVDQLRILSKWFQHGIQIRNDLDHIRGNLNQFAIDPSFDLDAAWSKNERDLDSVVEAAGKVRTNSSFQLPQEPQWVVIKAKLKTTPIAVKPPGDNPPPPPPPAQPAELVCNQLQITWKPEHLGQTAICAVTVYANDRMLRPFGKIGSSITGEIDIDGLNLKPSASLELGISKDWNQVGFITVVGIFSDGRRRTLLDRLDIGHPVPRDWSDKRGEYRVGFGF